MALKQWSLLQAYGYVSENIPKRKENIFWMVQENFFNELKYVNLLKYVLVITPVHEK